MAKRTNPFPSLNGATPITTLSFLGCATSTPINEMVIYFFFNKYFIANYVQRN